MTANSRGALGLGLAAVVLVVLAGLTQHNLDDRRCIEAVRRLPFGEQAAGSDATTVGQRLRRRYPDGTWHVATVPDGDDVWFETPDGDVPRWHCSAEHVPFVRARNPAAEELTPFNLPVQRLRERALGSQSGP